MIIKEKLHYFEYFLSKLVLQGYSNMNVRISEASVRQALTLRSYTVIKLLKLLYFVSSRNIGGKYLNVQVFDQFFAMPYGPVESDIYNHLSEMVNFEISANNVLRVKKEANFVFNKNPEVYTLIDRSMKSLYEANNGIYDMLPFDLVELSHRSEAWRIMYNAAISGGGLSKKMDSSLINRTKVLVK